MAAVDGPSCTPLTAMFLTSICEWKHVKESKPVEVFCNNLLLFCIINCYRIYPVLSHPCTELLCFGQPFPMWYKRDEGTKLILLPSQTNGGWWPPVILRDTTDTPPQLGRCVLIPAFAQGLTIVPVVPWEGAPELLQIFTTLF